MHAYPDIELYIDGHWKRASGRAIVNPADESVLGTVPHASMRWPRRNAVLNYGATPRRPNAPPSS
jgi:hypothetical protein